MSTLSRNKGAAFEREIAKELEALTGVRFKRNLEQVRTAHHGDLEPSDPAFPFTIECKRRADGNACAPAWRTQALDAAAKAGTMPAVVYRHDRRHTRVCVPMAAVREDYEPVTADADEWVEMTLGGFAMLASELMAALAANPR